MTDTKHRKNNEVQIIVERHYTGEVTPIQAILPIVLEDLRKKYEKNRTLEKVKNNN